MWGHIWKADISGLGSGLDVGHEKDDSEASGLSNKVSIAAVYSDGEHRGKNK